MGNEVRSKENHRSNSNIFIFIIPTRLSPAEGAGPDRQRGLWEMKSGSAESGSDVERPRVVACCVCLGAGGASHHSTKYHRNVATFQGRNVAASQHCNVVTAQWGNVVMSKRCKVANVETMQCCDVETSQHKKKKDKRFKISCGPRS